jgi:tetratricopeptide (TPR) repeat protein
MLQMVGVVVVLSMLLFLWLRALPGGTVSAMLGERATPESRARLSKAESIDTRYFSGGIFTAWGRFYFKLPWPKYDARHSEQMLRKALRVNPDNVRARVFLAELYEKEGHPREARKLLQEAIAHQPGSYDPPEERWAQRLARDVLAQMDR